MERLTQNIKGMLIAVSLIGFCTMDTLAQTEREAKTTSVSMIRILANPDLYNNRKVFIMGFLHSKFEDSAIYFTQDHADHLDGSNAFWVSYDSILTNTVKPKEYDEKYVSIVGTFYAEQHGHMGNFAGFIKVESIQARKRWHK